MRDVATSLIFTPVPKDFLGLVWSDVEPLLKPAVETSHGKYSVGDIYAGLMDDTYVLWVVLDEEDQVIAAVTSRIAQYPGPRKALVLDWVGGSRMAEWMPSSHPIMVAYARDNECTHLEGFGREAWGRYMAQYGWQPDYTAYRMELNNGRK